MFNKSQEMVQTMIDSNKKQQDVRILILITYLIKYN